ncbi:hypothetical protein [Fictibacillus macauensis]|uniref:hypothetical protein n=1 Tax=Fictibacillus macauensis TaxID=245160 RepID=UPI00187D0D65|nr:hypothetical protein [Fictibacillus macauensis]
MPRISATYHTDVYHVGQGVSIFTLCYAVSAPNCSSLLAGKPLKSMLVVSFIGFTAVVLSRALAGACAGVFSPLSVVAATKLVSHEVECNIT